VIVIGIFLFLGLFCGSFYAATLLVRWMIAYLGAAYSLTIIALSPADVMLTLINVAFLLLFLVALPLVLTFILWYIKPALYEHERRWIQYIPIMYILAMTGLVVGWFMADKLFLPYFQSFSKLVGVQNTWSLEHLLSFVLTSMFACAVVFQTPVVVTTLVNMNIIKLDQLAFLRKTVAVIAVVIAAVITPTPDAVTQLVVALPIYGLFEGSLQWCLLSKKLGKKSK
jgi:sec-independent protein translocase protein TatC